MVPVRVMLCLVQQSSQAIQTPALLSAVAYLALLYYTAHQSGLALWYFLERPVMREHGFANVFIRVSWEAYLRWRIRGLGRGLCDDSFRISLASS